MHPTEEPRITQVMTVEHHEPLREGLRALLSSQADIHVVCAAVTADEGFEEYKRCVPDVTIVDLHLPGGLELIRRIRRSNLNARVIALVDYEWDEDSRTAAEASGSEALPKDQIGRKLLSYIRDGLRPR